MQIKAYKKLALRPLIFVLFFASLTAGFLAYYQPSFILDLASRWVFC